MVKYLVSKGANITARNHGAMRVAEAHGNLHIVEYLFEAWARSRGQEFYDQIEGITSHKGFIQYAISHRLNFFA